MAEGLGAGAIFAAINTAFKFSEFVIQLSEVGSENQVFVRTIQRVRLDLEETERLLIIPAIQNNLASNVQKSDWIKQAIHSTKSSLNDIGLYVERVRADKDRDGEVSFGHRVRWVLKDHGKLENRRSELAACHQTLMTVLSSLHHLEMITGFMNVQPGPSAGDLPPPTYGEAFEEFKSPYRRRKDSKTKVPGMAVDETKGDYFNIPPTSQSLSQYMPPVQENITVFSVHSSVTTEHNNIPLRQDMKEGTGSRYYEAHTVDPCGLPTYQDVKIPNDMNKPETQAPQYTHPLASQTQRPVLSGFPLQEEPQKDVNIVASVVPTPIPKYAHDQKSLLSGNNDSGPINLWDWAELPAAETIKNRPPDASIPNPQSPTSASTTSSSFYLPPVSDTSSWLTTDRHQSSQMIPQLQPSELSSLMSDMALQPEEQLYANIRASKGSAFLISEMDGRNTLQLPVEMPAAPQGETNLASKFPSELSSDASARKTQGTSNYSLNPDVDSSPLGFPPTSTSQPSTRTPTDSQFKPKYRAYSAPDSSFQEGLPFGMTSNHSNHNTPSFPGSLCSDDRRTQVVPVSWNTNTDPVSSPSARASYSEGMILDSYCQAPSTLRPSAGFQYRPENSQNSRLVYSEGLMRDSRTSTFSTLVARKSPIPEIPSRRPQPHPDSTSFLPALHEISATSIFHPPHQSSQPLYQASCHEQQNPRETALSLPVQPCFHATRVASPSHSFVSAISEVGDEGSLSTMGVGLREDGGVINRISKSTRRRGMRDAALYDVSYP